MNFEDVTIISVIGNKNAGKTTLIRKLILKLKERGYGVGTLKYNIREFEIDHEGKDSHKYFHSGADSVALSSQDKVAIIKRVANPPKINEIIERYFNDVSIVIVEGYRAESYHKIKIIDSQETRIVEKDSNNELLLTKESLKTKPSSAKYIDKALDFIEDIISLKKCY